MPHLDVKCGRTSTALEIAEFLGKGVQTGALRDLVCQNFSDPAEMHVSEGIDFGFLRDDLRARLLRALRDHNQRVAGLQLLSIVDHRNQLAYLKRILRDQDEMGAADHSARHGKEPRMPAHHLDYGGLAVRSGHRPGVVDKQLDVVHRAVEAQRILRAGEVEINGLGNPDDRNAVFLVKLIRDPQRVFASDSNQRVEGQRLDVLDHRGALVAALPVFALYVKRIGPRRPDCSSAVAIDFPHDIIRENLHVPLILESFLRIEHQDALPALLDRDYLDHGLVSDLYVAVDRG